jgi:hypothetical protein
MVCADTLGVYAHAFQELERRCPDHIGVAEWHQAIEDSRRFLAQWSRPAEALGWDARDLFELPPLPDKILAHRPVYYFSYAESDPRIIDKLAISDNQRRKYILVDTDVVIA